ncbi:hypothetical protein PMAYCL1PPCAC_31863 [Pristionchus mayeri]|uniref:Uncharacterized protein n=1 Tax=Pristionchus mayeri TaxID=1317129 RepID=A0AAN5DDR1_9BILA|nr:hypothetical protein PMAYCL1PPCAC_31863 [Pristionchus mayeri]
MNGDPPDVCGDLYYNIYRPESITNDDIYAAIVDDVKDFIYESTRIVLQPKGYSGIPLYGKTPLGTRSDDLWKTIEILFKLSDKFSGLLFSISTDDPDHNPLFVEAEKNEVFPKGLNGAGEFNNRVYGCNGVLHVVTDSIKAAHPNVLNVDIVRKFGRETRNILLTEAVKSRVLEGAARSFGMHRAGVNLPEQIAYIARQRPDLLSAAVAEFSAVKRKHTDAELIVEASTRVMVHVNLCDRDWKAVNQIAEIHEPLDIVSHRLSLAMIDFDRKYSNCENGVDTPMESTFAHVGDEFERERLTSLVSQLKGEKLSLAHLYQSAKRLITEKHVNLCYNLYQEGAYSSDGGMSSISEDDRNRRTVRKKRVPGKKRALASIPHLDIKEIDSPVGSEDERNPSSGHFNSFERAVNGDEAYKASSPEHSLGEDEEMSMFAARSKNPQKKKKPVHKRAQIAPNSLEGSMISGGGAKKPATQSDDDGFDFADLLNAAPPLAANDDFDI